MTEPHKERCETCRFWDVLQAGKDTAEGRCHRNAPDVPWPSPQPKNILDDVIWPLTNDDDWCGEWQGLTRDDYELDTTPEAAEELRRDIQTVLKQLSWREREVIKLRYGLGDGIVYTLEEVGHIFKVTRERIRQIERKAIIKIGMMSGADKLLERFAKLQQSAATHGK